MMKHIITSFLLFALLSTISARAQWVSQSSGTTQTLLGISFSDGTTGTIVGTAGVIKRTTSGGATWTTQTSNTTKFLRDVFFSSQDTGTIVGESGLILRTTNGGTQWTDQISNTTEHLVHVHFADNMNGITTGQNGVIRTTTDGGTTWSIQTSNTTVELAGTFMVNPSKAYAVGFAGTILVTTDGGTTWSAQNSGIISNLRSVSFPSANTGYVVGYSGTILKTTNGGANWVQQSSGTTQDLYAVTFTQSQIGAAVGTGTILRTTDGGIQWGPQTVSFTGDLYDVDVVNASHGWTVGQTGKLFFTDFFNQTFTKIVAGNPIATDAGSPSNSYTGSSWIDYDSDGKLDLFVNRGVLYHNVGNGVFTRVATAITGQGNSIGNTWADYDNDGDLDCFISGGNSIGSMLYRNDGNGVFTKITTGSIGNSTNNKGWACAWGDYDNDGYADLVIAAAFGFNGITTPNRLFHNNHDGSFTRIDTGAAVINTAPFTIPSWSDFDNDGDLDLFFGAGPANGTLLPDYLFKNMLKETGQAFFTKITSGVVATDSRDGQIFNWIDYDNDGDMDVYITNYGGGALPGLANDLYRNDGGTFTKITTGTIVTDVGHSLASVWGDFDNDGDLDCFVTNDASEFNKFYQNNGDGTFTSITTAALVTAVGPHYGATAGDYDNDGDLDLFVSGTTVSKGLFRNDLGNGDHWVEITCKGTLTNRVAIGTKVRIKATIHGVPVWQLREVSAQNSFGSQNSLVVHFGLGDAALIDSLKVEWPTGMNESFVNIIPDQFLTVVENDSTPVSLLQPADGAINQLPRVMLQWNRNAYGAPYHIQVATDSAFAGGMIVNDSTITDTTTSILVLLNNSTYYWRVQSSGNIHKNVWSSVQSFINQVTPPSTPILISPASGAVNQPITPILRWHSISTATSYALQLSSDSLFGTTIVDDSTLTDTSKHVPLLLNQTKYYWRVRGMNIGGSSPFTTAGSFTTIIDTPAVPQLLTPAQDSINLSPTLILSWNPAALASSYRLDVSTDSTFVTTTIVSVDSTTSRQVGPLLNLTKYFWRVRASNIGGTSGYSVVRTFTTIIAAPLLRSPSNGGNQSTALTLRWFPVTGASTYHVEVATDSQFTGIIVNDPGDADTSLSLDSLTIGTTYYWRVRAMGMTSTGAWSTVWKFTVALTTVSTDVSVRWNLVSVPVTVADGRKDSLFPTASSVAYAYDPDSGYKRRDTLTAGTGYWLKFPSDQSISLTGTSIDAETVQVKKGWNIIGSLTLSVAVSSIVGSPPGLMTSHFFGYSQRYFTADTIQPGKGYWVKADRDGFLILSSTMIASSGNRLLSGDISELPPPVPAEEEIQRENIAPTEYSVEENYPNPFNPVTIIRYQLPVESHVSLTVYNALGQELRRLVYGVQDAGYKSVEFDASSLPSGTYFYILIAGDFYETRKMVLMK